MTAEPTPSIRWVGLTPICAVDEAHTVRIVCLTCRARDGGATRSAGKRTAALKRWAKKSPEERREAARRASLARWTAKGGRTR